MTLAKLAPGVWRGGTRFVNWYLVDAGDDGVTVVDAGLPAYGRHFRASLAAAGLTAESVRAVVLTHGHVDHVGGAAAAAAHGAPVYIHPADAALARNPRLNRTQRSLTPYLRWPTTWAFVAHCLAQGALTHSEMPPLLPLAEGELGDAPGKPRVLHTPGHTEGSCVLHFPEHGVAFVGDLFCTVSAGFGRPVPPRLPSRGSNHNSDLALASTARIEQLDVRVLLPGHGRPWRDGAESAAASVKRFGCW